MGVIVGEAFEDFGNTLEYSVGEVRAYERLSGDRVRLYVTEEKGDRHILAYTVIVANCDLPEMGKKCCEIAAAKPPVSDWENGGRDRISH